MQLRMIQVSSLWRAYVLSFHYYYDELLRVNKEEFILICLLSIYSYPMKWFDSLFSDKSPETSLKSKDDVAQNHSHTSYRDIKKRSPISLVQGIFDTRKSFTSFSLRKKILQFCEAFPVYLKTLTRRHWFIVALLLLLAYVVYGVGFLIRTERHLDNLRNQP